MQPMEILETPQQQEAWEKAQAEYWAQMDEAVKQNPMPPERLAYLKENFKDE